MLHRTVGRREGDRQPAIVGDRQRSRVAGLQPRAPTRARFFAGLQWNLAPERNHLRLVLADQAKRLLIDQPGHDPPVVGTRIEENFDLDRPRKTLDPPQQLVVGPQRLTLLGFRRDRHQIRETRHAVRSPERRFEHGRLAHVPARRHERLDWSNPETATATPVDERREDRRTVEPWPAEPVDRPAPRDERRRPAVANQRVVADGVVQGSIQIAHASEMCPTPASVR